MYIHILSFCSLPPAKETHFSSESHVRRAIMIVFAFETAKKLYIFYTHLTLVSFAAAAGRTTSASHHCVGLPSIISNQYSVAQLFSDRCRKFYCNNCHIIIGMHERGSHLLALLLVLLLLLLPAELSVQFRPIAGCFQNHLLIIQVAGIYLAFVVTQQKKAHMNNHRALA